MKDQNVYQKKGYKSREDYLHSLAEEQGVPYEVVIAASDMLGPTEDFDGLVSALEDYACMEGLFDE